MFEIKKDQLRKLSDVHLRELVARLCEAELRNANLPVSAVRWSGAHTAPDGGLDIECRVEAEDFRGDFVPRRVTGLQVKKPSMPPAKIADEMSPHGALRPIFSDLAAANGCYIIVSLDDDPTGEQLRPRLDAMQGLLEPVHALGNLQSRFYGRAELANWLRQHPAVQLWVRDMLGIPLQGWRPFGRWTATPPGDDDQLICAPGIAILLPGNEAEPLDTKRGIAGVRDLVRGSGRSVRVVGLSGLGKTRIVQALFEDSVGNGALDRNLAIYADLGMEPEPSPRQLLDRLATESRPAILVLDNCPTDTHNLLAGKVSSTPDIHLITVEYDIREDKPDVTAVVQIIAEGPDIAEALVLRRHPGLGHVNARVIAKYSGGNARLALVLADAVGDQESLSDFSHAQLFERLFFQRGVHDERLLAAAEALSLVYSFSLQPDEGGVDELGTLAELAGLSRPTLYRAAQILVDRQLVQKRSHWRAVLPPAVANRLAARALRHIPVEPLLHVLEALDDPRLLKSFGRRLGYLHDHEVAQDIVRTWLSPGGKLHDIDVLDGASTQLLGSVAPVAPDALLDAIEVRSRQVGCDYFVLECNPGAPKITGFLSVIAHDPALFERGVALLARFALTETRSGQEQDYVRRRLCSLFWMCLSGTEAGPDAREKVIRRFLYSEESDAQRLGLDMLKAALKSGPWLSFTSHEFGARPRSFGYQPSSLDEQIQWFRRFLTLALEIASRENDKLSDLAGDLIASQFRGLWRHPALRADLAVIARTLHERRPWHTGWMAVRSIKHYDYRARKHPNDVDGLVLLNELDELLKPKDLVSEIRTYVLTPHLSLELDDEFDFDDPNPIPTSHERGHARAFDLGETVAGDPAIIGELSGQLFQTFGGYLLEFGRGMASRCVDPQALWTSAVEHLERAGDSARHCLLLQGILEIIHQRDASLAEQILDKALQTRNLRQFFVGLQVSIPLDRRAVQRLLNCLDFEDTPVFQFGQISWPGIRGVLEDTDLARILLKLMDRPDGLEIVLSDLNTRASDPETEPSHSFGEELSRVGLRAASQYLRSYSGHSGAEMDNSLGRVLNCSMNDDASLAAEIDDLFRAFFVAIRTSYGYVGNLEETAQALISMAPQTFLDRVFLGDELEDVERAELFAERHWEGNVLSGLDPTVLLDWCSQGEFRVRLALISEAIYPLTKGSRNGDIELSDQARVLLDASPDALETLTCFSHSVQPSAWSGSLAEIISRRRRPFELLLDHEREDVRTAAAKLVPQINDAEERARVRERAEDQERDLRFE